MPVLTTACIDHSELVAYAERTINLSREDARIYRDQVNRLREKLDKFIREHPDYGLIKMLLSGSLAKGTALKTLNDIDIAIYIQSDKAPEDWEQLLNWLAEKLREAYPQMHSDQIIPINHGVRISFRGTGLDVDVVPVRWDGDPDDRGYLIARDTGEQVLTSIPLHIKFIRARKSAQPDHFAQVVRFVKWWAREKKKNDAAFRFKSFMAELILANLSDNGQVLSDYPTAMEKVFTYIVKNGLKDRIYFTDYYPSSSLPPLTGSPIEIIDPVNENNNVAKGYTDQDRRLIVEAAEEALDALAEARFATTKERAVECWQDIFGQSFRG